MNVDFLKTVIEEEIIAFSVTEPGGMGFPSVVLYTKHGQWVEKPLDQYEEVKKAFPVLRDCYFNGPMGDDEVVDGEIILFDEFPNRSTHIPKGWKHMYLGGGSHLVIKENLFPILEEIVKDEDKIHLSFSWAEVLDNANFAAKIKH